MNVGIFLFHHWHFKQKTQKSAVLRVRNGFSTVPNTLKEKKTIHFRIEVATANAITKISELK